MAKTMQEVLAEHWSASTHTDQEPPVDKCDGCGAVLRKWGDDSDMPAQLAAHQAAALSAAGYGLVTDAKREAVVIHVPHDMEAHARSFNEGYETAIAQELADDPTTAQDWLDDKLREAKAEALLEAADEFAPSVARSVLIEKPEAIYDATVNRGRDWLRARAAGMRQG